MAFVALVRYSPDRATKLLAVPRQSRAGSESRGDPRANFSDSLPIQLVGEYLAPRNMMSTDVTIDRVAGDGNPASSGVAEADLSLAALSWPELLSKLADFAHSELGQEAVAHLALSDSVEEIEDLLQWVDDARALRREGGALPFGPIWNLRPRLLRLEKGGSLVAASLLQVARTLRTGSSLRRFILARSERVPALAELARPISPLDDIWGTINEAFQGGEELADHASGELRSLRRRVKELNSDLAQRMRRLMDDPHVSKFLQDRFYTQREDRYVIPVRADAGSAVEGIVLGSSSSGATMFIEPRQVVGLNNELKVAELAVVREEARILAELSQLVAEESAAIHRNQPILLQLDLIDARARFADAMKATRPTISQEGGLDLRQLRHPLMSLGETEVVPSDICLEAGQGMVISGPNAGGKTVCLKALGLSALMLRAGMHIPVASDSHLPIYEKVLAEVGDNQSIEQNLSTFSAHLQRLMSVLESADSTTLVLVDEIATGTDPREGEALAQSILEGLIDKGAQIVVTTHYDRLKALPMADRRFVNASVGFELARLAPTYRVHQGIPGSSCALAVATLLGLSDTLTARAESLLDRQQSELSQLLAELADLRNQLEGQQRRAEDAEKAARQAESHLNEKLAQLKAQGKRAVEEGHRLAMAELKQARTELSHLRVLLKRDASSVRPKRAERKLAQVAQKIIAHQPQKDLPQGRQPTMDELRPGMRVVIPKLGGLGEVLDFPRRRVVTVQVGALRTQVSIRDIFLNTSAKPKSPSPSKQRRVSRKVETEAAPDNSRRVDNTLECVGMRVAEAIDEVDKFIDQALLRGEDVLYVVHGYGTGALRAGLRQHFRESPLVVRHRAADKEDGGDAVTVFWLAE
jgi:DNA mismatch repair protein MutS2